MNTYIVSLSNGKNYYIHAHTKESAYIGAHKFIRHTFPDDGVGMYVESVVELVYMGELNDKPKMIAGC